MFRYCKLIISQAECVAWWEKLHRLQIWLRTTTQNSFQSCSQTTATVATTKQNSKLPRQEGYVRDEL